MTWRRYSRLSLIHIFLRGMALYCGFPEESMDQVFITLDKMDKIGYEGVEKELLESGYCPESVSKYLDILKNVTKDSAGVRALGQMLSEVMPANVSEGPVSYTHLGLKQSSSYQMVYGFDFENSYDVRTGVDACFSEALSQGRMEFEEYLERGMSMDEAAASMEYGRKAEAFYEQVKAIFEE